VAAGAASRIQYAAEGIRTFESFLLTLDLSRYWHAGGLPFAGQVVHLEGRDGTVATMKN
jgi:hypothetical protein